MRRLLAADFDKRMAEVQADYIKRGDEWGQVAISRRAKAMGLSLSQSSVSRCLNGESKPGIMVAETLALVLGVNPEWLAFGKGEKVAPKSAVRSDHITTVPVDTHRTAKKGSKRAG